MATKYDSFAEACQARAEHNRERSRQYWRERKERGYTAPHLPGEISRRQRLQPREHTEVAVRTEISSHVYLPRPGMIAWSLLYYVMK